MGDDRNLERKANKSEARLPSVEELEDTHFVNVPNVINNDTVCSEEEEKQRRIVIDIDNGTSDSDKVERAG